MQISIDPKPSTTVRSATQSAPLRIGLTMAAGLAAFGIVAVAVRPSMLTGAMHMLTVLMGG